ncbi:putative acyl-CoA synthetase [Tieghemostelium lacteum]|uniref:Putative acyl-CoA synthetase n=1 Tax=Tieghemostelium lacteum TaxID=361077 RepID=A0A152A6E6_TIELA|nr:putative acyl-CoA synthetase [Tieghemostelium lacteum]|eukprot:KYR01798.1 putative acyl-CoA synthetase [Tieghemostelium lacteum]
MYFIRNNRLFQSISFKSFQNYHQNYLYLQNNGIRFYSNKNDFNQKQQNAISEHLKTFNYEKEYKRSIEEPEKFWDSVASQYVHWNKRYDKVMGGTIETPKWFEGGVLNAAYNCLDVHVRDPLRKDQIALIQETPGKGWEEKLTYQQLYDKVCLFARGLVNLGVGKGDRVIIYMPMINEGVIAMLACARIGAIHSVVFGGFASAQLANRIEHSQARLVISSNYGIDGLKTVDYKSLLGEALDISKHKPNHVVLFNRDTSSVEISPKKYSSSLDKAMDWNQLIKGVEPLREYQLVESSHPLYLIYTSGTTGAPKGIIRETGGYMAQLNYAIRYGYGMQPGDVFWAGSDIGWVVGHSLCVYGALACGLTSIIFEGKPILPDPSVYWRLIEKYRVKAMFSAPTAIRAIHRDDPEGKHFEGIDLSSLKYMWLAGERLDTPTQLWLQSKLPKTSTVGDHYWTSESGCTMLTQPLDSNGELQLEIGVSGKPFMGFKMEILDDHSKPISKVDEQGEIAIRLPVPPGFTNTLYLNHPGYIQTYQRPHLGYSRTGDSGYMDSKGYFHVVSRIDDVINTSGHRISTGSIEEVLAGHASVVECAVIGVPDEIKGEIPFGFVILKHSHSIEKVEKELIQLVRNTIGPVAVFKNVLAFSKLPKTRSGKIMRNVLRKIYNGDEFPIPPTIEDPDVLSDIKLQIKNYHNKLNKNSINKN